MNKRLVISGCSYGVVYSEIELELKETFDVDEVVNLSRGGASPDRQIRVVIEWIAQNGKPDMVIIPVSHYNRFDLPIATELDPLHNLHHRSSWTMNTESEQINPLIDRDTLKMFLKTGSLVNTIEHTVHDYLFVKLITFQSYLQMNGIRHLIFDTGNYYEKLWMRFLSIDEEHNSGYQPGMKKRDLVEKCPGIYKFFTFCSNAWMYEQLTKEQKKNYFPWNESEPLRYPLRRHNQRATIHHRKEQVIKLMKHLQQEGAVYG
jgi:hypothetical protein